MTLATFGPAGGKGGNAFADYLAPENGRITAVHIYADRYIDAIQLEYTTESGEAGLLPKIGGLGGELNIFALDEDEWITGISGEADWYVDALVIHTNKRKSPVFGGQGTQEFAFLAAEGSGVVGFFGRADWYVDALGIYTRPLATPAKPEPISKPVPEPVAAREPQPKDLQKVEGIGPKIAGLLIDKGIYNLADLAKTPVDTLQGILAEAGRRYAIADPSTWPEQAALGAEGAWDKMKALQDKLKGGRRVK